MGDKTLEDSKKTEQNLMQSSGYGDNFMEMDPLHIQHMPVGLQSGNSDYAVIAEVDGHQWFPYIQVLFYTLNFNQMIFFGLFKEFTVCYIISIILHFLKFCCFFFFY